MFFIYIVLILTLSVHGKTLEWDLKVGGGVSGILGNSVIHIRAQVRIQMLG